MNANAHEARSDVSPPRIEKTIYLIRHGESISNVLGVFQGSNDPLTQRGRAQAKALGERLKRENYPIERIVASTHARARETATILGSILGQCTGITGLFVERKHPTCLIGKSTNDPEALRVYEEGRDRFHDPQFVYGNGETFKDLKTRALRALDYLRSCHEQHVAVVSHGVFATILFAAALRGEALTSHDLDAQQVRLDNTGLCVLTHGKRRTFAAVDHGWIMRRWNDTAHLIERPELCDPNARTK